LDMLEKNVKIDPTMWNEIPGLELSEFFKFLKKLRSQKHVSTKLDALIHNFLDFKESWTKFGSDMVPMKIRDVHKNYKYKQRENLMSNRSRKRRRK